MYRLLATGFLLAGLLKAQASSPEALLQQAVGMQQRGDLEQAIQAYKDFLSVRPNEAAVRSNLGVLQSFVPSNYCSDHSRAYLARLAHPTDNRAKGR